MLFKKSIEHLKESLFNIVKIVSTNKKMLKKIVTKPAGLANSDYVLMYL